MTGCEAADECRMDERCPYWHNCVLVDQEEADDGD